MNKILISVATVLLLLALFALTACALEAIEAVADVAQGVEAIEEVAESGVKLPVEPFTWKALGTIAGCTAFALLFVQLIKAPLDKVWKIPTRALVYVVCLVAMLLSAAFGEVGMTIETALLAAVNAVIPTLAAMGAYEMTFGRRKDK